MEQTNPVRRVMNPIPSRNPGHRTSVASNITMVTTNTKVKSEHQKPTTAERMRATEVSAGECPGGGEALEMSAS